jgi:hypothetical protein
LSGYADITSSLFDFQFSALLNAEEEMTEQTEITEQTDKQRNFRLSRYFRLFRHLFFEPSPQNPL